MTEIRGVFFDFYDTLTICDDPVGASQEWSGIYDALKDHGCALPAREFCEQCPRIMQMPEPARQDGLTVFECRIQAFCREMGFCLDRDAVKVAAATTAARWQRYIRLDPEAVVLLEWLRPRVGLALITNFDHPPHVRSVLNAWGLTPQFQAIAISGERGASKPDPAIFHWTFSAMGLRPDQVLYVGDSDSDVVGAKGAGCRPVRIRRAQPSLDALPRDDVATVQRLSDIPGLIEGMPPSRHLTPRGSE